MDFLNPSNSWTAQNLPEGLSLHAGVLSGTPAAKGAFSVPVTVSNQLGSDTKNISIIVKNRPGTEKFSILQNGQEVAKLTIPELQDMVQDGSAQSRFNCYDTQLVMPMLVPSFRYSLFGNNNGENNQFLRTEPYYADVLLNFCSFRNVTLQNSSVTPGLILQFDKTLWRDYAPFDTGDVDNLQPFGRWRYSTLRQWLNSEGLNWFRPAYDGDSLIDYIQLAILKVQSSSNYEAYKQAYDSEAAVYGWRSSYADSDAIGFLDLLHDDIHSILQPVRVVTKAAFDDDNTNLSIDDPEDVDGVDADVTFDKVFIPSIGEMHLTTSHPYTAEEWEAVAVSAPEGSSWEFWIHKFSTYVASQFNEEALENGNVKYPIPIYRTVPDGDMGYFCGATELLDSWGEALEYHPDMKDYMFKYGYSNYYYPPVAIRSQRSTKRTVSLVRYTAGYYDDLFYRINSDLDFAAPAPAFVIC